MNWILTIFIAYSGATGYTSDMVSAHKDYKSCAEEANTVMRYMATTQPGTRQVFATEGFVILEHPSGDQTAFICETRKDM